MVETSQKKKTTGLQLEKNQTKKRDRSASEDRLLKAAEEIFSKFGFKATTTRMIAKKADINESLIGRYFEGKLGLFFAVIDNHIKCKAVGTLNYPAQETLTKELLKFAEQQLDEHCRKNTEFFKIVLSQSLVDAKFLKKIRERIPNFEQTDLRTRMTELQKAGKIVKTANVDSILHDVDTYFHGTMLFDLTLHGRPRDQVALSINHFITNYARTFES